MYLVNLGVLNPQIYPLSLPWLLAQSQGILAIQLKINGL